MPDEGPGSFHQPVNLPSSLKNYFKQPNQTIEQALSELEKYKSVAVPQLTGQDVRIDEWNNQGKEPNGVFENYNMPASGVLGLTPMPKNTLK